MDGRKDGCADDGQMDMLLFIVVKLSSILLSFQWAERGCKQLVCCSGEYTHTHAHPHTHTHAEWD